MPSRSKAQQRFMGLVHAYKKGEVPASKVSKAVKDAAKSMKKKSTKDFASTKHDDLPNKVREYLMSENPAASAAAAMAMMKLQNPSTGQKVSAVTPLRDKDHPLHKKSKSIFQRLKDKFMKKNESVNEDGHTDVASIERKLKLIVQDANDVINALKSKSNEDSLPSWWTDKITLAKDYVGKSRDFIMNPTEGVDEGFGGELTGEDKKKFEKARKENAEQLGYKLTGTSDIKESVNEGKFNPNKIRIHTNKAIGYLKQAQKFAKEGQKGAVWQRIGDAKNELKIAGKFLESVNEATSLGADMIIGGIASVVKKAGMRPKSAKMMGGGFKVSKRDKVGFKIDVEIRGMDKKKTFPLQFETERGMLYVVIKNKPIKLGKYTMVAQAAQNLKKVGAALIGDKNVKRIA